MYNIMEQAEEIFLGMALDVPAGSMLYGVMPGDKVRVKATIQYRGPAYSDYFYAAIGEWRGITWPVEIGNFDELWSTLDPGVPVSFALSGDWVTYELTADILITKVAKFPWTPGWFDVYAKLRNYGITGLFAPKIDNKIEILLAPEFQNFAIATYDRIPA